MGKSMRIGQCILIRIS